MKRGQKIYVPRGPVAITHPSSLTDLGYVVHKSDRARHIALRKAVNLYGQTTVLRRINALYVFNKNRHPDVAEIYQEDKAYVHSLIK